MWFRQPLGEVIRLWPERPILVGDNIYRRRLTRVGEAHVYINQSPLRFVNGCWFDLIDRQPSPCLLLEGARAILKRFLGDFSSRFCSFCLSNGGQRQCFSVRRSPPYFVQLIAQDPQLNSEDNRCGDSSQNECAVNNNHPPFVPIKRTVSFVLGYLLAVTACFLGYGAGFCLYVCDGGITFDRWCIALALNRLGCRGRLFIGLFFFGLAVFLFCHGIILMANGIYAANDTAVRPSSSTISLISHAWLAIPASIAGVTRRVL